MNRKEGIHLTHTHCTTTFSILKILMCLTDNINFTFLHSFSFHHRTGLTRRDDNAFQLLVYPNDSFECRMYLKTECEDRKRYVGCSLSKGSHFVFFIVIGEEAFEVWRLKK